MPNEHLAQEGWDAATWEGAARLRRQQVLALTPAQRLALLEEMIQMAIDAGTFRTKLGEWYDASGLRRIGA